MSRFKKQLQDVWYRIAYRFGLDLSPKPNVNIVADNALWAIYWMAEYIRRGVNADHQNMAALTTRPGGLCGRVVHFGTRDLWLAWKNRVSPTNKFVATCLHGSHKDGPQMSESLDRFLDSVPQLSAIVTATRIMESRLLDWGVPKEKLIRIPLGVDGSLFVPVTPERRKNARKALGIPGDRWCIGSFQKDGVGWGKGMEPKRIKGPDVFIEAVSRLNRSHPVFVLLTGAARGYVKQGLRANGIPFVHHQLDHFKEVVCYYHALDSYIVSAREEGGPLALPESMATGIPMVTTAVGMAPEMIRHEENGMTAEPEDVQALADHTIRLIEDVALYESIVENGFETARAYDWTVLATAHYNRVYRPLLDDLGR